ncbi:MAG: FtsX-like permease family protein [Cytophagales bacterium]|nr:FtsX-like permease family protein [Cytophagales bacterium]
MSQPPKFFRNFFRWFCHPRLYKPIEGDLMELYYERVDESGKRKADLLFIKDVLALFRKDIIRPANVTHRINQYGMIKNYTKTTWRNLKRQKVYAAINIGGLSLSIACVLLIVSFISYEYSYDRFLENHDEIYRVYDSQSGNDFLGKNKYAVTPIQLASALREEYPEVQDATVFDWYNALIGPNKEQLYYQAGIFADAQFFDVFPYEFVAGNPETAMDDRYSVILTESLAAKIFDHEDAMGKSITHREQTYQITGIIKDPPKNATLPLDFVMNVASFQWYHDYMNREKWRSNGYHTFFTLNQSSDLKMLESKMPQLLEKYWINLELYPQHYQFESLSSIHLQSSLNFDFGGKGSKKQIMIFATIAVLIMLLALVNYTNLAVARSMNRSKEVGLRKTIGANRSQLMVQFLFESIFLTFIATLIAILITWAVLPLFGKMLERELSLSLDMLAVSSPYLLLQVILLGLLAGYYPAFLIARLQPINALKGKTNRLGKRTLQKALIVGQYTVSIAMIICALAAQRQFYFIQNKDLGFQKEHILTVRNRSREVSEKFDVLRNEWLSHPNILAVTGSQNLPIDLRQGTIVNDGEGTDPIDNLHIYQMRAGYDFLDLYDIDLIAGRKFTRDINDSLNLIIINEATLKVMGWTPEEAIGKRFSDDAQMNYREVIGVVKDFHMHSMHMKIEPMFIERRNPRSFRYLSFKINPQNFQETLAFLDKSMASYTSYPFDAQLLTDKYNALYKDDLNESRLFNFFTLLAVLIASLGLFGLATYTIHLRVKEVGIRKVLGATVSQIISLVSKDFLTLVVIGFIVAIPAAWFAVEQWLEAFSYRISISGWVFASAGCLALIIAFLTISSQSLKVALSNPAKILKDE